MGALHATDEVICAVAEALIAGVAKRSRQGALPASLRFVTGSIGLLGTKASWELIVGCDTLLMVKHRLSVLGYIPKEDQASRAIRSTSDPGCWAFATPPSSASWATPR
ncbi:MAG: hypothetical protein R3A52_23220 [Polyangiales bacterium]